MIFFATILPAIIEFFDKDDIVHSSGIVIGTKEHDSAPPKLALVGGFVEVGETSEEAVIREVRLVAFTITIIGLFFIS